MSVHPEVEKFMTTKFRDTDLTPIDLTMIGQALLNWVNSTVTLGHTRPGHTLDYTPQRNDRWLGVVRDFVIWTSGRTTFNPHAQERLTNFIQESGWQRHRLEEMSKQMGLKPTEKESA